MAAAREYEKALYNYFSYRLHEVLVRYASPALFIGGMLGNLLAIAVLSRPALQKMSAYVLYLIALNVADTFILLVGLLRQWLAHLLMFDIKDQSAWICKFISVAGYTISDYSVWLIVAATAERYLAVIRPLRTIGIAPTSNGKRRAVGVMIVMLILLFAINAHLLWTTSVEVKGNNYTNLTHHSICTAKTGYDTLVNSVWPWLDAVIYSVLPMIFLFTLNSLIISTVCRAKRHRLLRLRAERRVLTPEIIEAERGKRFTVMLLAISITFVITTLPQSAMLIVIPFRPANLSIDTIVMLRLMQTISELLMYTNHSINFYLYCAVGSNFRHQFSQMIKICSTESRHVSNNSSEQLRLKIRLIT